MDKEIKYLNKIHSPADLKKLNSSEYPELAQKLCVMLPDEEFRRVGQSMAAASLPEV